MGQKRIAFLVFFANLRDTFEDLGVCKCKLIRILPYLLSDGTVKAYEAYTADVMSTDANDYDGSWSVIIKAFIQRFLTHNVVQKAYDLVTNQNSKPDICRLHGSVVVFLQLRRKLTTMFEPEGFYLGTYVGRTLTYAFLCAFQIHYIECIAIINWRLQRALLEHEKPRKSMITKINKRRLPKFAQ